MKKELHGSQPVDLVIIKNNIATMVEAKNLDNKSGLFNLDRVEMNQLLAYKRYCACNNTNFILAIKNNNNVYFIDFGLLQFYDKSIDLKKIEPNIINFDKEASNDK